MRIWIRRVVYFVLAFGLVLGALQIFPLGERISVETQYGTLLGKRYEGVNTFLGVPFAQAPVGEYRWRSPQTPKSWMGEKKAYNKGPACMQGAEPNPAILTGESEDCLYLNIWVPEGEGPFPVLVWYHGGGFILGSGSEKSYDGETLARTQKVAVITTNYRLGYHGHLSLPPLVNELGEPESLSGNQGELDQVAALQWIKENGEAFNIDTSRVAIFGESAGSISVCQLLASPLTDGLIYAGIMQSGACSLKPTQSIVESQLYGLSFLEKIGCKDSDQPLVCARGKSHAEIYDALGIEPNEMFKRGFNEWAFQPSIVVGSEYMPKPPIEQLAQSSKASDVALILGVNADEGSLFDGMNTHAKPGDDWVAFLDTRFPGLGKELAELYPWDESVNSGEVTAELLTDAVMLCPTKEVADIWSESRPTYLYYFNQEVMAPIFELIALQWNEGAADLGVAHALEIPYVFGVEGVMGFLYNEDQYHTQEHMQEYWANLAKVGNPNRGKMEQTWPIYFKGEKEYYIEFNDGPALGVNLRNNYCEFWRGKAMDF